MYPYRKSLNMNGGIKMNERYQALNVITAIQGITPLLSETLHEISLENCTLNNEIMFNLYKIQRHLSEIDSIALSTKNAIKYEVSKCE